MLEIVLFLEFLKSILNLNYNFNFNIDLTQKSQALAYEDFIIQKEEKKFKIDETKISAQNVLIKEIDGKVLFERNSLEQKPIASLTKLLTAVVALQTYNQNEFFLINGNIVINHDAEKNSKFKSKEIYSRDKLINAMIISSSNVAAWTLAEKIGQDKFVKKINDLAKEWGLNNTFLIDPAGVSEKNISNLNDLYLLVKNIFKNYPEIFEISRKSTFYLKDDKNQNRRYLYNTNYLISKYQDYIIGSKTGFTSEAGQCLLLLVKYPQSPLIFIGLLNSKDRVSDAEYLLQKLKEFYD
jgi:D-alanyl-D-alanine carboxypeptidase